MRRVALTLFLGLVCCRGAAPQKPQDSDLAHLVDSLRPAVERVTGLTFNGPTRSELKSKEEVRAFLLDKLRQEFPAERQEGVEAAYKLLGLLPDSLNLRDLLLDLYSEQVAGYYDPATSTLYGVRGAERTSFVVVVAHELVHALQHRYLPLDSIMKRWGDADQQTAVQALLEGHAMLNGLLALTPNPDLLRQPQYWSLIKEQVRSASTSMPVLAKAPLVLKESLVFPYLGGAEWVRWWDSSHAEHSLPAEAQLPRSTEQILHPDRYLLGDQPLRLRFDDAEKPLYEDTFGEREIQVLVTVLQGRVEVLNTVLGWGGDRFRAYRTPGGPALVWYLAFDETGSAERFVSGPGARLAQRERAGYRTTVTRTSGGAHPTIRIVIAPAGWARWENLPKAGVVGGGM